MKRQLSALLAAAVATCVVGAAATSAAAATVPQTGAQHAPAITTDDRPDRPSPGKQDGKDKGHGKPGKPKPGKPGKGPHAPGAQGTIYLSPDGDDGAAGTEAAPLATLEAARDAIRALRAADDLPDDGVTVYLREGTYERSASFTLGAEDSGTADAPITYRSYPGETATVSGGKELPYDGFSPVTDQAVLDRVIETSARDDILQIDLGELGIDDYGQLSRHGYWKANDVSTTPPMELYVDGQDMTLARWPNAGAVADTVQMNKIIDPGPTKDDADLQDRGGTFSYSYDRPQHWGQADDIWLDGIFGQSWEWSYNKIESIDTDARTITLRYGEMSGLMKTWYPDFHFAQNLLEELDAPGEYYIDRATGMLYLVPNASFLAERGAPVVTTLDEPMIRTDGTSYVTFDDLVLDYGRANAAVILGGSHVTVSNSDIQNFTDGGVLINSPGRYTYDGIPVNRGGTDHAVVSNDIRHVGGVGVVLQGGNKTTLAPGNNRVEDSHIHDFAYYHKAYNPGVMFDGVGNVARGNEINDAPHPGIIVHGNDHLFEQNEVYDVCKTFQDLGAIYMNSGETPQQRGHVFRQNYFHDVGLTKHGVEGIYADNFTWDLNIEQNVFVNMGNDAIKSGSADYIDAVNNVFVDTTVPYDNYTQWMGDGEGNTVDRVYMPKWEKVFADNDDFVGTPYLTKYPELGHFFEDNHYFPNKSSFGRNVIWNPNRSRNPDVNAEGALDTKNLLNYGDNWVTDTDPGFVDAEGGDYAFRDDAAVFDQIPGFEAIPFDEIGTDGHVGHSQTPDEVALESLALPGDQLTITLGDELSVAAQAVPWNATNQAVAYASSDPEVATVSASGVLTAIGPGELVVTVESKADPAIRDEMTVTVAAGDGVLHRTDFESGANGWPTDANRAIVDDGTGDHVLRVKNGANTQLDRQFSQYALDFTVTTPAEVPEGGQLLVYDRTGATPGGYVRYRHAAAGSTWTIFDSAWGTVKQVTLPAGEGLAPGTQYDVRVVVTADGVRVLLDGEEVVSGANPAPAAAGKVGFYVQGFTALDFDDVTFSLVGVDPTSVTLAPSATTIEPGETWELDATFTPADATRTGLEWSSSDAAVATVDADGTVRGVSAGTATITATSTAVPGLSASSTVTVQAADHPVTDLGAEILDATAWAPSGGVTIADGAAHLAPRSASGFAPATFGDELLRFDTSFGDFNGGWFGFSVRSRTAGLPVWTNSNSGYLVVIKEDVIEMQRWKPDVFMIDVFPNTVIEPGSTHEVTFGTVAVEGGVRVVLRVDGEPVWSYLDDTPDNPLAAPGYFTVYRQGPAGEMSISPIN
ncbi:Ig-like domain-containing protein [Promicromonospora kroppenstedtii]|uniref:Ig-like domain-containing protein n=1 Tax=Promicromonospora kroppenstedtii TaxID=440482 RepID=UPI0004ACFE1E|nr:Ig-like domain-containing protein [Promicromonospora kroppenstedtii]